MSDTRPSPHFANETSMSGRPRSYNEAQINQMVEAGRAYCACPACVAVLRYYGVNANPNAPPSSRGSVAILHLRKFECNRCQYRSGAKHSPVWAEWAIENSDCECIYSLSPRAHITPRNKRRTFATWTRADSVVYPYILPGQDSTTPRTLPVLTYDWMRRVRAELPADQARLPTHVRLQYDGSTFTDPRPYESIAFNGLTGAELASDRAFLDFHRNVFPSLHAQSTTPIGRATTSSATFEAGSHLDPITRSRSRGGVARSADVGTAHTAPEPEQARSASSEKVPESLQSPVFTLNIGGGWSNLLNILPNFDDEDDASTKEQ